MSRTRAGREGKQSLVYPAAVLLLVFAGTVWAAQIHLPKIPKMGKSKPAEQKKEAAAALPGLTAISPNSASPGGEGDLVLTGSNFTVGTGLRMNCSDTQPSISSFKVDSPTRAVAHVRFGFDTKEGPCEIYLDSHPTTTNSQGEITASTSGTVEVVQVKSVSFTISIPSAMPMALPVMYVGEGNMEFMEIMMKMQQAMQGSWNDSGKPLLFVSRNDVKLVQGNKTVFDELASNIKEVGEMSMMGQTTGVFRLVCTSGKIYNFMEQASGDLPKGKTIEILKATLGK
jgi:hypothetical protein